MTRHSMAVGRSCKGSNPIQCAVCPRLSFSCAWVNSAPSLFRSLFVVIKQVRKPRRQSQVGLGISMRTRLARWVPPCARNETCSSSAFGSDRDPQWECPCHPAELSRSHGATCRSTCQRNQARQTCQACVCVKQLSCGYIVEGYRSREAKLAFSLLSIVRLSATAHLTCERERCGGGYVV